MFKLANLQNFWEQIFIYSNRSGKIINSPFNKKFKFKNNAKLI